ncbi:MAG TPA: metallophosphoesterase [archaeon]|nr:metallophosphoesterase [archaeon]
MRFLHNAPAVLVGDALVIADVHIGIEHEFWRSGIRVPSQTPELLKRLKAMLALSKAKKLVVLGDVKHKIPLLSWQEQREVPEFFSALSKLCEVHIVPGNHDGDLRALLPAGISLHPPSGLRLGDSFFVHGHAWPDKAFLERSHVFAGHTHPHVSFRDTLGSRWSEPCWVRAPLRAARLKKKYGPLPKQLPQLTIVPAFHPLSGGYALNERREKPRGDYERVVFLSYKTKRRLYTGPLSNSADLANARINLLDGTLLGQLKKLRA